MGSARKFLALWLTLGALAVPSAARAGDDDDLLEGMRQMIQQTVQQMKAHRSVTIVGAPSNAQLPSGPGKVNARVGAVSAIEVDASVPRGEVPCDDLEKIHETRRSDSSRYYSWSALTPAIQTALRSAGGPGFRQPAEVEFVNRFFELCQAQSKLISALGDDDEGPGAQAAPEQPQVIDFPQKPQKKTEAPKSKPSPAAPPVAPPAATMRTIERPSGIELQVVPALP